MSAVASLASALALVALCSGAACTGAGVEAAPTCRDPEGDEIALLQTPNVVPSWRAAAAAEPAAAADSRDAVEEAAWQECGPTVVEYSLQYQSCWEKRELCCVSRALYGTLVAPGNETFYPASHSYAWVLSAEDLELGLRLRAKFGDSPLVNYGLQVAAGLNPLLPDISYQLAVFNLAEHVDIWPPTWAMVSFTLEQAGCGEPFPTESMKEITLTYSNLAAGSYPHDALEAWRSLTGCSRECSAPFTQGSIEISRRCGCKREVVEAAEKLLNLDAGNVAPNSSPLCMKSLLDAYPTPTAGQLRLALYKCMDMLPVSAGVGLGYNTIVSPLFERAVLCSYCPSSRYSGLSYLIPNLPLSEVSSSLSNSPLVRLDMQPLSTDSNSFPPWKSSDGYCAFGCGFL